MFCFELKGVNIPEEHHDQLPIGVFLRETEDEIIYQYDFTNDWFHQIIVEKVLEKNVKQPEITAGIGMYPVEDSGGIWNWNNLLKLRKMKPPDRRRSKDARMGKIIPRMNNLSILINSRRTIDSTRCLITKSINHILQNRKKCIASGFIFNFPIQFNKLKDDPLQCH
ncbi:plasmid pRiA4b ORF-3 family protein [Xenorhabdus mauleonii]|uniref:plasmid pRiA4b ORF-3 family protein n=1 Tax=Xenorhabdus mauleonii TaxID=351675 RepID=UPI001FCE5296|nr:plasmid pRiA4b ORF-3 family protein [Xenorhabdus mauleonii]